MTARIPVIGLMAVIAVVFLARTAAGGSAEGYRPSQPTERRSATNVERSIGSVPIVKQVYRNNCETASLSMLLAAVGVLADQSVLQRQVAKSRPLDPRVAPDGTWTWGDPDRGFVGRARGGGPAGGFGVYQAPIRRLARRYGVQLDDLTGRDPRVLFARLRRGRPVLAWVGLSQGPYRRWRTSSGKRILVNLGEHAVVLVRLRGSTLQVNDPLTGERKLWSTTRFLAMWDLLGRRAVGV